MEIPTVSLFRVSAHVATTETIISSWFISVTPYQYIMYRTIGSITSYNA
jgi:hypothetical protein